MTSRFTSYLILFLVAVVLTILPAAMWADMAMPMEDNWENWYWKGQPHPRPEFSLQNPPMLFRAELFAYKTLVSPAAYVHRVVKGWPTTYASFFMRPYVEAAGIPPLAMALQHSAWALPTWFLSFVVAYEVVAVARRSSRRSRPAG